MKRFLVSAVAFGVAAPAMAADLPVQVPVVVEPPFTWTGFYAGLQAGGAFGNDDFKLFDPAGNFVDLGALGIATDYSVNGFVGGGHIGYNYQFGRFVIGLETDIEGATVNGDFDGAASLFIGDLPVDITGEAETRLRWLGSVRGRLGAAFDRTFVYATGGFAYGGVRNKYVATVNGVTTSEEFSQTRTGWTAGAGIEQAFTNNITGRLEYRYTSLGDYNYTSSVLLPGARFEQDFDFHAVRAGLSYKF